MAPRFLWRDSNGNRVIGWRLWVLVWVTPVVFALATLWLVVEAFVKTRLYVTGEAEVVRVYAWDDTNGVAPLFRYEWSDGLPTEATPGLRHKDWNFPVGSRHEILFNPWWKTDVVVPGPLNWFVAKIIALCTIVTGAISGYVTVRLWRWRAEGKNS
ncbi:MAG: hypothetical protein AB3N13_12365 [Arenibacterium sp.]